MTTVGIGIVSWNTADLLDRCLTSLPAALGDLDASVVVVDNASTDDSADIAARHAAVTVLRNPINEGYARAMNRALTAGDHQAANVLVALNPDTEPPPGSLALLADRLLAAPDVGLVVPRLVYPEGRLQHSAYRFPSVKLAAVVCFVPRRFQRGRLGRRWWLEGFAPHDRPADVDWAIGAVHVLRRRALRGERPYSERWFMYVEDLDLCWRLARRGWRRRLEADIAIPHVGNASGAQAWGETRTARWTAASYDWYALARGRLAMRAWAAVNTVGVLVHIAAGAFRFRARARARELRGVLRVHLRALWAGPPSPDITTIPPDGTGRRDRS
ncbi:MAG: glycosyltransferase [Acidimicrobiales bacterium]